MDGEGDLGKRASFLDESDEEIEPEEGEEEGAEDASEDSAHISGGAA